MGERHEARGKISPLVAPSLWPYASAKTWAIAEEAFVNYAG